MRRARVPTKVPLFCSRTARACFIRVVCRAVGAGGVLATSRRRRSKEAAVSLLLAYFLRRCRSAFWRKVRRFGSSTQTVADFPHPLTMQKSTPPNMSQKSQKSLPEQKYLLFKDYYLYITTSKTQIYLRSLLDSLTKTNLNKNTVLNFFTISLL